VRKYLLLALIGTLSAAAPPPETNFVAFIPDQPLGYGDASGGIDSYDIDMIVDGAPSCSSESGVTQDADWICKGSATPGSHEITASIHTDSGATWRPTGRVDFVEAQRAFEYPGKADPGDIYWCVLVSKTQISLLSASDQRCHTD
jgi:hypothetical protein